MAFLDNSGDIILDAVLTDDGRQMLARGDGSFKVAKFALGDDEINYGLYDKDNENGTPSYDIDIMQTPVFEAFTNNIASLNSRLISFQRNNLFYLPILKINDKIGGLSSNFAISKIVQNGYILAVDEDTEKLLTNVNYDGDPVSGQGVINGFTLADGGNYIQIDQGIDNEKYPPAKGLDIDLKETQYLVEIDNRIGTIIPAQGSYVPTYSSLDDDDIASYYFALGDESGLVTENNNITPVNEVLAGARGTRLKFKIRSSAEVTTSDYLFNQVGTDVTSLFLKEGTTFNNVRSILTTVRITGLTTGYSLDVPVVVIKYIS